MFVNLSLYHSQGYHFILKLISLHGINRKTHYELGKVQSG